MSINTFHISGRATKDPVIKQGANHLVLGIAVNSYDKKERTENTDFFNVFVYGKTAVTVQDFVRKGDRVFVEGSVGTFKRQNADFAEVVLRARTVEFATIAHPEVEEAPDQEPEPGPRGRGTQAPKGPPLRQGRGWGKPEQRNPEDPDSYA